MKQYTVGIVGASGYSGEVLLELLSGHPAVGELVVASRSYAGQAVEAVLPRLAGRLGGKEFCEAEVEKLAGMESVDLWFLALPHGVAAGYALSLVEAGKLVIDLSADFRLRDAGRYEHYYKAEHPAAEWLEKVPYVFPEWPEAGWEGASLVACPGCYPTSVLLPLLPLYAGGLMAGAGAPIINSMSGLSGAGKKANAFFSFGERWESVQAYGIGEHRHLAEIEEQLGLAAGQEVRVQFTPHLVPVLRGIATTMVLPAGPSVEAVRAVWARSYDGRRGVRILEEGEAVDTRPLIGRNRVDMNVWKDERTGNTVLTSGIDNLMKGASGQAVQIMNLRLGLEEWAGLR